MKKTLIAFALLVLGTAIKAQSPAYENAMQSNIALLESAKTASDYINVSNAFERIAHSEKTQWLPFYYAALAQVRMGLAANPAEKDKIAEKVSSLVNEGEAIEKNGDFYCIRFQNATMQMLVDPRSRWQTYGFEIESAYRQGVAVDPGNPRLYLLKGLNVMNTPEAMGGGKEKARPYLEKAVSLYAKEDQKPLYPNWGYQQAKEILDHYTSR